MQSYYLSHYLVNSQLCFSKLKLRGRAAWGSLEFNPIFSKHCTLPSLFTGCLTFQIIMKWLIAYEGNLKCGLLREGILLSKGALFAATLSKAMLTKQFTKSHVLLDKDTHWTMSLLKWHQSVDTTNNTVCWQIISCTSFYLWLSFIMQIGNQVLLWP